MKVDNIIDRVVDLKALHDKALPYRDKFRRIINGGVDGTDVSDGDKIAGFQPFKNTEETDIGLPIFPTVLVL